MSDIRPSVENLNQRILEGDILGAFDEYYADDVVMQEAGEEPRRGKETNREFEKQFVNSVQEFHEADVRSVAVDEEAGKSFVEWHFDFTLEGAGRMAYDQVAVQDWEDGKIKEERFYKL